MYCHHIDGEERRGKFEKDHLQGYTDKGYGIEALPDTEVLSRCPCLI